MPGGLQLTPNELLELTGYQSSVSHCAPRKTCACQREQQLIARDPMAFYITDHYENYPAVLVRPTIEESVFRELIESAWRHIAHKGANTEYDRQH